MDRRTFIIKAAQAVAVAPLIGCTGGSASRKRLSSGTSGWYADWRPEVVVAASDSNVTAQSKIDAHAGGIIGFGSGSHVERRVIPRGAGQRFIGRADGSTRFDGSRDVGPTGWSGSGRGPWRKALAGGIDRRRVVVDATPSAETRMGMEPFWGTVAAQLPEELWVKTGTDEDFPFYVGGGGWKRLGRVLEHENAGPGEWKLEYGPTSVITMGDDPAQFDEIRISVTDYAVKGNRHHGLFLADLWVDRYATAMHDSPLGQQPVHKTGWHYHHVTVSGGHSSGFTVSAGTVMRNCIARHNGRFGVTGTDWGRGRQEDGAHWQIEDCRFTRNLLIDYNGGHGGGGAKLAVSSSDPDPSLLVNSWFDWNNHHGVWPDHAFEANRGVATCEMRSNLIEHNAGRGFQAEIWAPASLVVRWNRIYRNGVGDMPGNVYGLPPLREGARIVASRNVRFVENQLEQNDRGILIADAERQVALADVQILRNEVHVGRAASEDGTGGVHRWQYDPRTGGRGLLSCGADANRYHVPSSSGDGFQYDPTGFVGDFGGWQMIDRGGSGRLDPSGSVDTAEVGTPDNFVPFVERQYGAGSGLGG